MIECIPMNIIEHPEAKNTQKRMHTPQEIKNYIGAVELVTSLPYGILTNPNPATGFPYKDYNGVSVCDIRQAAILFIAERTLIKQRALAKHLGIKYGAFFWNLDKARNYYEVGDSRFMHYYRMIEKIAV